MEGQDSSQRNDGHGGMNVWQDRTVCGSVRRKTGGSGELEVDGGKRKGQGNTSLTPQPCPLGRQPQILPQC